MAQVPSPEDTAQAILDEIKGQGIRGGEIANMGGIQSRLFGRYTADDLNAGFQYMLEQGWIEPARSGFVKLTDAGHGPGPSVDETVRAILDGISRFNIRAGQTFPVQGVVPPLYTQGFRSEDVDAAIADMVARGLLENKAETLFLTEAGFDEM